MIDYSFREVRKKDGSRKLLITFADEQYDLVAEFLQEEDLTGLQKKVLQVLETEKDSTHKGKKFRLALFPAYTVVYDDSDDFRWCQINTEDLYDVLEDWQKHTEEMQKH